MASLETGIRNALLAEAAGIDDLIGDRLRPLGVGPDDVRPYLTYQVSSRESNATLDGVPADYRKAEFEIGIFADTYDEVMTLSELVRDRLDGFGETVDGIEFAPCMFDGESDVEEATPEGEEKPVYLRVLTFRCLYKSTV